MFSCQPKVCNGNLAHRDDDSVAGAHPEAVVGHQERGDPDEAEPEFPRAYNEDEMMCYDLMDFIICSQVLKYLNYIFKLIT